MTMKQTVLNALADFYGCESTEESIKEAVYDNTECGAFVAFYTDRTVGVGSIIEGSDAEVSPITIAYTDDGTFIDQFKEAVQEVESQAHQLWLEANDDE